MFGQEIDSQDSGGEESILQILEHLQHNDVASGDMTQQLDVVQHEGNFYCMSNRRLTALMMYQGLHRDNPVRAWCRICSGDTQKFREANSTLNSGLGIDMRE